MMRRCVFFMTSFHSGSIFNKSPISGGQFRGNLKLRESYTYTVALFIYLCNQFRMIMICGVVAEWIIMKITLVKVSVCV